MRAALPMLPAARRTRLAEATDVAPDSEAAMVVVDRGQDDYVLAVGAAGGDVARALVHVKEACADSPSVPAADLAKLTTMEVSGALTATQAKTVLAELSPTAAAMPRQSPRPKASRRWTSGALDSLVDQAISDERGSVVEVLCR